MDKITTDYTELGKIFEPYKFEIKLNGYELYWNIIKLNWLQKILLRLLGIKISKYKEDYEIN